MSGTGIVIHVTGTGLSSVPAEHPLVAGAAAISAATAAAVAAARREGLLRYGLRPEPTKGDEYGLGDGEGCAQPAA